MLAILEEGRRERPRSSTSSQRHGTSCSPASCQRPRSRFRDAVPAHVHVQDGRPKGVVHVQGGFLVSIAQEVCYQADARSGDVIHFATDMGWIMGPWIAWSAATRSEPRSSSPRAHQFPVRSWRLVEDERLDPRALADALVRALIPHGSRTPTSCVAAHDRHHRRAVEPGAVPLAVQAGRGLALPDHQLLRRHRGRRLLPLAHAGDADQGLLARRPGARNGDGRRGRGGWRSRSWAWARSAARLPQTVPTDPRLLARSRALHRDLLVAFSGVWTHGDWASVDEDGWFLHGRSDDTLNIAGKRVGPAELESAAVAHPAVAERPPWVCRTM